MSAQRGYWALMVLFAINTMNFFDRQILGAVGEAIKRDWGLSDTALGGLNTAFVVVYALVGLPLGRLADTQTRTKILGIGVFAWSVLTAASGLCKSFAQLFVVRLGVGLGEASCAPAASSLIGDLYPANKRSNAMSVFMLGLPVGIALSFLVGGYVAKNYGWQQAFFIAALPGLLCAAAAWFLKEPTRGASEAHAVGAAKRQGSPIKLVLSIPSIWPIVASGALHNFNMYAIGGFLASFIIRYHKVDIAEAGYWSMPIYGLSGIPGLLFGGILADALTKRWAGGRMLLSAAMFFVAAPLTYVALLAGPGEKMAFAVPMGLGVAAMYVYYSATYSTIQDLVEPSLRGMAMAVYFCAMYLLGGALGTLLLGKLSDHYTIAAAVAAGVTEVTPAALAPFAGAGLHTALYIVPILNLALTGCMLLAAKLVPADIAKMQAWMRDSAGKAPAPEKAAVAVVEART